MASIITRLETGHEDLVHNIEYDYYGKRLVSCSSDQRLKVWDRVEHGNGSTWELNDAWKGHDASVIKASWAPAEYGQIIASCSFDRTVKIWEEQPVESKNSQCRWYERFRLAESKEAVMDIAFSPVQGALRLALCSIDGIVRIYECLEPTNLTQWSQMEEFAIDMGQDSSPSTMENTSLNAMIPTSSLLSQQQLLQQHQLQEQQQLRQLQLQQQQQQQQQRQQDQETRRQSSSSTKLQQQDDNPTTTTTTTMLHQKTGDSGDISADNKDHDQPASVSGTRSQPPHLGSLGSPPTATTILQQFQQHLPLRTQGSNSSGASSTMMENSQLPFAIHVPTTPALPLPPPMSPRITSLLDTTPGLTLSSLNQHYHHQRKQQQQYRPTTDIESGFCIHWCPNRTATAMMVVGLGKEHGAKIFKHDGHSHWQPGEILFGHTDQVNDVSWAPSMGRTYQLIATACRDHFVRIYKLTHTTKMTGTRVNILSGSTSSKPDGAYHVEMAAEFGQHQAEVWHVEWNIMGTILSSSGRDGSLRLWKARHDGAWCEMTAINTSSQ